MFSVFLACSPRLADVLTAELSEAGTTGIAEEPGGLRAFFDDAADRTEVAARFAPFAPRFREEPARDWVRETQEAWPALLVGTRFYLTPPWDRGPTPPGRLRLEINPGMACGTGYHPCTQMCLEALERYLRPGDTVLDVGAGSGILSKAAALLGAACVYACDIDADAVRIARAETPALFFAGSADGVRSGAASVVAANISSAAVEELHPELMRVLKPGGTLIVSGFEEWDPPEGYEACDVIRRDGWMCLVIKLAL